jgi:apolipoprotein D and lipocalin family protein
MKLRFSLLALWLLAVPGCHAAPLDVVEGVDLQRFEGQWYEIAKLPRVTQADCTGTIARYERKSDHELVVTNSCRIGHLEGSRRQVVAAARVPNPSVPAKLSMEFGGFFGDYWIIDLDREGYRYAVVGHPTRQYLWILSRTPALPPATLDPILERAMQKGFDVSRLEYTKQMP